MSKSKIAHFEKLRELSEDPAVVEKWVRKKPKYILDIIQTALENIKQIVLSQTTLPDSQEYMLALHSVTSLGNILSTEAGLRFMVKNFPSHKLYDLLIWSIIFLKTPNIDELKKATLRCVRYVTTDEQIAHYIQSNQYLYRILKFCLNPHNANDIIENGLIIAKNLLDNIVDPKLAVKIIEQLPMEEIKRIIVSGQEDLQNLARLIFVKAVTIYRLYQIASDDSLREMISFAKRFCSNHQTVITILVEILIHIMGPRRSSV